ncbi:MAG: M28 family peptidase [Actinobacteria bacterium]|nr:M28 family peptidase [Actinomycetota bacterium]
MVDHGIRRPGYRADRWVERWAADRFEEFGLEDVHLEPVEVDRWNPGAATLVVEPGGDRFRGFPAPHTAPGTVDAEFGVLAGDAAAGSFADRIAVYEFAPLALPGSAERELSTFSYDPDGDFDSLRHILPFNVSFNNILDPAITAGAAGFVGLLTGFPWNTRDYYVPYDGEDRDITAAWFSGDDGRRLLELIAGGATRGRLEVEAERTPIETHNVVGTLPGASDEWVIVASHHDGPWASAVEDGSGISLVLAQAAYWSGVPARERPHNMLFLLSAAHMFGGAGTTAFIGANRQLVDETVLEVHLEHAARNCVGENGELVPTEDPEIRWWFTSENPALQGAVQAALEGEDLRRSVIFRPDVFFETPPTDGAAFHGAGVPIVHFLTAPMYLFDRRDTIDKIHEASLEPLSRAAVRIIESTQGVSAAAMRNGIVPIERS